MTESTLLRNHILANTREVNLMITEHLTTEPVVLSERAIKINEAITSDSSICDQYQQFARRLMESVVGEPLSIKEVKVLADLTKATNLFLVKLKEEKEEYRPNKAFLVVQNWNVILDYTKSNLLNGLSIHNITKYNIELYEPVNDADVEQWLSEVDLEALFNYIMTYSSSFKSIKFKQVLDI